MTVIRATIEAIRALPATIVERINRWVLDHHAPFDVYGDGSEAICPTCKTPWPCEVWIEADLSGMTEVSDGR